MIHKLNIVQQSQEFKQYSRLSLRKQIQYLDLRSH